MGQTIDLFKTPRDIRQHHTTLPNLVHKRSQRVAPNSVRRCCANMLSSIVRAIRYQQKVSSDESNWRILLNIFSDQYIILNVLTVIQAVRKIRCFVLLNIESLNIF